MGMMVTVGFSAAVKLNSGPTNPLASPSGGTIPALTRKSNVAETLETSLQRNPWTSTWQTILIRGQVV